MNEQCGEASFCCGNAGRHHGYNCNSCTTSVNVVAAAPISRIDITDTSESAHFLRDCQLKLSLTGAKKWQGKLCSLPIGGKKWADNCPPCPIGSAASAGNPALCESSPLVTPFYCRLGDLLCFVFMSAYCTFDMSVLFVPSVP